MPDLVPALLCLQWRLRRARAPPAPWPAPLRQSRSGSAAQVRSSHTSSRYRKASGRRLRLPGWCCLRAKQVFACLLPHRGLPGSLLGSRSPAPACAVSPRSCARPSSPLRPTGAARRPQIDRPCPRRSFRPRF